jgi:RNA polymerase sigma-70 factor (ECF subfamily)
LNFIKNTKPEVDLDEMALLLEYRRTGNLALLGKLYERYMHLVFGLCLKYLKDEEQSKDAVMQIFEELISKLRVHQVSNFKSWLYTLARNYCLMFLRSSGKQEFVTIEDNFMEKDAFVHLDIEDTRERKLSVMEECIEKLPPEQKETIKLFYLEEKCYKDVADTTGYDLNKVKSYIQNGKRNLKICMEKSGEQ